MFPGKSCSKKLADEKTEENFAANCIKKKGIKTATV